MSTSVLSASEIVSTFNTFFRSRGHHQIPGGSLVPPPGDPVLFTSAGMHPLTPYLLGQPHPGGPRLSGLQRCLRMTDLDEVGDPTHLTVFQMLGTWSLGDYNGPQSLRWGLELLCDHFGLQPGLLHATVFGGDGQTGPDTASLQTWTELGVPAEPLGPEDNWWSNGPTGPCGPDSELFIWTGDGPVQGSPSTDPRWLELWNHVTMRYLRHPDGNLTALSRPSVDTGMGLERLAMVCQGVSSVYESDLFEPWLSVLPGLWHPGERSLRLITDHLRSAIVVIGDGVRPASTGRGYVLRRLLRRALTALWQTGQGSLWRAGGQSGGDGSGNGGSGNGGSGNGGGGRGDGGGGGGSSALTLGDLPLSLVTDTGERFGLSLDPLAVREVLLSEERKFGELVRRGCSLLPRLYPAGQLAEADYRYLHETHGLPRELVTELVADLTAELGARLPAC